MSRIAFLIPLLPAFIAVAACAEPIKSPPPPAAISLTAAIGTAEQQGNGKAIRAEYEQQKDGTWIYDVKIATNGGYSAIKVDAIKGTILSTKASKPHDDDDEDEDDDSD